MVDLSDDPSSIGMIFNVDLSEVDSSAIKLGLEPCAVTAPTRSEEGRNFRRHQIHSHDMYNCGESPVISITCAQQCVGFFTLIESYSDTTSGETRTSERHRQA